MELEEGEVADSDPETDTQPYENFDYTELKRPPVQRPAGPTRDFKEEELNESSDERDSDSSNECTGYKKRMMSNGLGAQQPPKRQQMVCTAEETNLDTFNNFAAMYQKRKLNNVWADVLKEQSIGSAADELGLVAVAEDVQVIKRGSESFVIENTLKRKYMFDFVDDLSDLYSREEVTSAGLSEDSKEFMREPREPCQKKKTSKTMKDRVHLATSKLSDDKFCAYVADRLRERKFELIEKVVKHLGREATVYLFAKTLVVEQRGGLLIKNGSRRRTPGGVFLYLLRGSKKFDEETVRQIFDEEHAVDCRKLISARRGGCVRKSDSNEAHCSKKLSLDN